MNCSVIRFTYFHKHFYKTEMYLLFFVPDISIAQLRLLLTSAYEVDRDQQTEADCDNNLGSPAGGDTSTADRRGTCYVHARDCLNQSASLMSYNCSQESRLFSASLTTRSSCCPSSEFSLFMRSIIPFPYFISFFIFNFLSLLHFLSTNLVLLGSFQISETRLLC
jgi:hypothetical protein